MDRLLGSAPLPPTRYSTQHSSELRGMGITSSTLNSYISVLNSADMGPSVYAADEHSVPPCTEVFPTTSLGSYGRIHIRSSAHLCDIKKR